MGYNTENCAVFHMKECCTRVLDLNNFFYQFLMNYSEFILCDKT